jgi:hypothetical protein
VGQICDTFSLQDDVYAGWLVTLLERVGMTPPPVHSIGNQEGVLESTENTFILPPDSHPAVHLHSRSPFSPLSAGATDFFFIFLALCQL